jgi:hypothetical protein
VIVVEVGDEDSVESVEHPSVCRFCTPEVRHPVAEHRVGQESRAV